MKERRSPNALRVLAALALLAAAAAARAGDPKLWVGFYHESPAADPDPTAGLLLACLPEHAGTFRAVMVLSFTGCTPGIDAGIVQGRVGPRRAGRRAVQGSWSGSVDGLALRGAFSGVWGEGLVPIAAGHHAGTLHLQGEWSLDGGGRWVGAPGPGSCGYHVGGRGHWRLVPPDTATHGIVLARHDTWSEVGSGHLNLGWHSPLPADAYVLAVIQPKAFCRELGRTGGDPARLAAALPRVLAWAGATDATRIHLGGGPRYARVPPGHTVLEAFRGTARLQGTPGLPSPLAVLMPGRGLLSAGGLQRAVGVASMYVRPSTALGATAPDRLPDWAH